LLDAAEAEPGLRRDGCGVAVGGALPQLDGSVIVRAGVQLNLAIAITSGLRRPHPRSGRRREQSVIDRGAQPPTLLVVEAQTAGGVS
jgi:hypothetical protein